MTEEVKMREEVKPEAAEKTAEPAAKEKTKSVHEGSVSFSVDGSLHSDGAPKRRRSNVSKRQSGGRSSFLNRMGMSFKRSKGDRGANIETLRGINGADFEGNAMITRGDGGGCGCWGGSKELKEYILLIKGPFCFVFKSEEDLSPKYAISLAHMRPGARDPSRGRSIVTLETSLGDVEYEMSFADETTANAFKTAVGQQAAAGEAEEIRKRLGHEHLLTKRSSVRYAETVAMKKINDAPEKEVGLQSANLVGGIMMDAQFKSLAVTPY